MPAFRARPTTGSTNSSGPSPPSCAAANSSTTHARRTALSTWELDEETWQHLASEARARTDSRYLARGPHDRVDRLAASVAVWQRATHGHYRYAPLLKTAPGDWFRRSDRVTWKIMLGRGSSPVGIELHRLLSDYADQLGTRIDAS
ncbi:MAG TPA: hypothetical protein VNV62_29460 [Trebonia sp.]|nr:hypothetical protein [Trebonia sp.]